MTVSLCRRGTIIALCLAATLLLLTGCSDFVDRDQQHVKLGNEVTLDPDHPVGQTFVARHGGLNGVEFWLEPKNEGGQGEIQFHLRTDSQAEDDLITAALPRARVTAPGFYRFSFPPRRDSHGEYFYAFLEMPENGRLAVGAGPGDAYLDGALYRDHEPQDVQMAFRLAYDPGCIALELAGAAVRGVGLLGVAGLLYVVPGWALLAWLWPKSASDGAGGQALSWPEKLGLAAGLSLALYPLLFLWTDVVGFHIGSLYAWIPILGGIAALTWKYRDWQPRKGWDTLRQWARSDALWPDLALLLVTGMVFAVRLLVVRTLDAPMWGDSYQHTMIAQLLVDNDGLFDSWEPYAELQSFTYHFGFHTAMAALHWVTGTAMHKSVLWGAQVLNGLAVLALYPLAVRVSGSRSASRSYQIGSRWAGVGTVLVAGLLSPMPMYYVNWGRYTQLAGQIVLPAAVLFSWSAFEASRRDWRLITLSWIAVGGLALSHYRVLIFYAVFVLAWTLLALRRSRWRRALGRVIWVGAGAALLFLPWFVHVFAGKIMRLFWRHLATSPAQLSSLAWYSHGIGDLSFYLAPIAWVLLIVAAAVGLWDQRRRVLMVSLWWFLLLLVTNPVWLQLPGSGIISNPALFMAAYIPAGVLIGYLLGQVVSVLYWNRIGAFVTLVAVGMSLLGLGERMKDVRASQHAMVTRPDLRALEWVRENTSEDAQFLINSFFAYGETSVVGSDGGWWLPLLARRGNTVPPLNYGTEQRLWPGYVDWVNEPTRRVHRMGIDSQETLDLLRKRGVTHVYIGQQQGRVNYGGSNVLDPQVLLECPYYRVIYHHDRVWVFEVIGSGSSWRDT